MPTHRHRTMPERPATMSSRSPTHAYCIWSVPAGSRWPLPFPPLPRISPTPSSRRASLNASATPTLAQDAIRTVGRRPQQLPSSRLVPPSFVSLLLLSSLLVPVTTGWALLSHSRPAGLSERLFVNSFLRLLPLLVLVVMPAPAPGPLHAIKPHLPAPSPRLRTQCNAVDK